MGPETLIAQQAIATVLSTHSRGVDRADANLLGSAYHPDATVDYGFFVGPASTLVAILAGAQKAGPLTLHRTSNVWARITGERAIAESYVIAYAASAGEGAMERLIGGRYLDRLECRDGEWRIAHRTYVMDWNTNRPSTADNPDPPADNALLGPRGGHAASDPGRALLAFHTARHRNTGAPAMAPTPSAQALDVALSKLALHELNTAYARGIDRGDVALLASVFHPDATVVSGVVNGTGAEFATKIVEFVMQHLDYCFHSIANEWFEVSGDKAVGESYVVASVTAGGRDVLTGGRYVDSFERRNGTWKISSRTFVQDWSSNHPASGQVDGMYETLKTRGRWGKDDPVYAHWGR